MSSSDMACLGVLVVPLILGMLVWLLVETLVRRGGMASLKNDLKSLRNLVSHSMDKEVLILRREVESLKARLEKLEAQPLVSSAEARPEAGPADVPPILQTLPSEMERPAPAEAAPMVVEKVAQEPQRALVEEDTRPGVAEPLTSEPVVAPMAETVRPPMPQPSAPQTQSSVPPMPRAPLPPTPRPAPRVVVPPAPSKPFDWESLVGVKLFSWIAGIAMLVAAVAFIRYGIENGWLTPTVRMTIGILVGLGLLGGCETKKAQEYAVTAHSLTAAGIATLFTTFFASYAVWHLVPAGLAFLLMVVVAAVAVMLSIRRDSVYIALLGLVGGFLTPALLSQHKDNPLGLFAYIAMLNVALAWVAYRKRWAVLMVLTLGFTVVYQFGWALRFLNESKLGIGLGVFLLFPIMAFGAFLLAQWRMSRSGEDELPPLFGKATALMGIPPLLFAFVLAAQPSYGHHYGMMFGFLLLVVAGLAAVALVQGPEWLHFLGVLAVLLVFVAWLSGSYTSEAWPMLLGFLVLFVALPLVVRWLQARFERLNEFQDGGRIAIYGAPLLLFVFPVLVFLEPATASPGWLFGGMFLIMVLLSSYAIRFEDGIVHFLGCFFVLITEALWSTRHLNSERVLPALAIYGGFGLFYIVVPMLAQRRGRRLKPEGSGAILAFASLALLFFLCIGNLASVSLWPLALLVLMLNVALVHEASCGHFPILSILGMVMSWILLAVWWICAPLGVLLLPALVVLGAFGLLVVGAQIWLKRQASPEEAQRSSTPGLALGLAGHVFLLVVASKPHLASPPWAWLAVLLVLDVALAVAALYLNRAMVLIGSTVLSQMVLGIWMINAPAGSSAVVWAPWISMIFAGFGCVWHLAAQRRRCEDPGFLRAAVTGLFIAPFLAVMGASSHAVPAFASYGVSPWVSMAALSHGSLVGSLVVLSLASVLGLLALSWQSRRQTWLRAIPVGAGLVVLGWLGSYSHQDNWKGLFLLSAPLYLVQLAYPLVRGVVLGARIRDERPPFQMAVLASVVFFFFGRSAFMHAGWGGFIGALPVLQALLLVPHLKALLELEPEGQRDLGRLALVAGSILAFITVAIPLQLEKEWITLGWALLGAALAWLYGRIPHKGLLTWCGGLFAIVFARLVLNPAVFEYHARSAVPFFNWYLYTYLIAALCFFGGAWLLDSTDDDVLHWMPRLSRLLPAGGAIMLFLLLNIEIADVFSRGDALTFNLLNGTLAQGLSYTIGWAMYAIGLLVAGIWADNRLTRVAAILLLTVTVFKAFLHDLSSLEGLYRVASFVGLAMSLALVAVVLQRFVLRRPKEMA